jgi:predicted phage baseplate assembly protein
MTTACACGCGSVTPGTCGCCEGIHSATPRSIVNRAGLDALQYRVGTHGSFLATMLAQLSGPDVPELQALAARDGDDAAIALLDAWATVADVLTFYQERIANEGYLRTSTERRSILEAARLVGYELRPGLAASVFLAYTLDKDLNGNDTVVTVPKGAGVQSVPGPGELPQIFETFEPLVASSAWNDLKPLRWRPLRLLFSEAAGLEALYLEGLTTNLKPGDVILLVFGPATGQQVELRVKTITPEQIVPDPPGPPLSRTVVALQQPPTAPQAFVASPPVEVDGAAVSALERVLGALERRTPLQPAGRIALERSAKRLFEPGSDIGPRLLLAFRPSLSDVLYRTWQRQTISVPAELQSAQAMRVKAAPFGATAALKPVLDARGAVVGAEEWPLADPVTLGVRVTISDGQLDQLGLTATVGGETSTAEHRLRHSTTVTLPLDPGQAVVKSESVTVVGIAFQPKLPTPTVRITTSKGHPTVRIRTKKILTLHPGDVLHQTTPKERVTVALSEGVEPEILTVTIEALNPPTPANVLALDAVYDQVVPGGWTVIDPGASGRGALVTPITKVATVAKTAYNLSAKVTQLTLRDDWLETGDLLLSAIRNTTVYVQSEPLDLAPAPVDDDVGGISIELDEIYRDLESGRWVIVEGERTDIPDTTGVRAAELAMLAGVTQGADTTLAGDNVHTTIQLVRPLAFTYRRSTVKVWGNVVKATHGQSRPQLPGTPNQEEVLGSGDATRTFQEFTLQQPPLTYLPAANPLGAESTLEVRVDGQLWHEVASIALAGPNDRSFVSRTDDKDRTTVAFGDGRKGTRPTTGVENVRASYRAGIGRPGNVKAAQITQLQMRPLGVNGVVNPLPASGGADRDSLEQARRNTPLAVKALDRLVSVQDYEDFTRARAGIGKTSARALSDGKKTLVHLTIAGADDIPIDETSDLYQALRAALPAAGDPALPIQVAVRELILLVISASVEVDPDYRFVDVEPKVRAALLDRFGFDRRELGQSVFRSEVQSVMQKMRGVVSVDVDVLTGVPETITPAELAGIGEVFDKHDDRVVAERARFEGGRIRPAQLALLSPAVPDTLILREVAR